jgi:NAD(P)-dependent dehydrogenase (short-subunit alcohol dehydrogenase family)
VSSGDTKNLFRLEDKVAIITGAAGLLGLQHALALSDFGATIVLTDIDQELCEQRASDIQSQSGIKAVAIQSDVREQSSWRSLLEQTLSRFGRVDILVNNAAFTTQSRSASIINMASQYGVVSPHHRMYSGTEIQQPAAYSVSKAGVIALTRYLGTLWAENGVRVNCITPGGVHNEHSEDFTSRYAALSPIGRMADREEMRGALVYLASAASVYCTGHNLVVDGGWTVW